MKAYIDVFEKENIEILAKNLADKKYEIYSKGETLTYLESKGIKTIKADTNLEYDFVVINLNSFEQYLDKDIELETLLSYIDEEKISLIRKFAKNYQKTILITSKNYLIDIDEITEETREILAKEAFLLTSKYDYLVSKKISKLFKLEEKSKSFYFNKIKDLKYGENSHQKASLYGYDREIAWSSLSNSDLSYNDILNSSVALEIVAEFFDVSACAIVKHAIPAAVALSSNLESALDKAIDSDPIGHIGATIAFSKEVGQDLAKKIALMSFKVVVAPEFSFDAINELKNKDIKIIKINTPLNEILKTVDEEIKLTPFGALIQQKDTKDLDVSTFKIISKNKPEQKELEDMIFASKVVKHVKSSAIVVAKDLRTIGISSGQTNKIDGFEIALSKVCDSPKGAIIATDSAITEINNIQVAIQNRISGIIQPAGTKKDKEIIEMSDKYQLSIVSTGISHLKH